VSGAVGLVFAWVVSGPARAVVAALALALLGTAGMQRALDGLVHHRWSAPVARGDVVEARGRLVSDPDGSRFRTDVLVKIDGARRIFLVRGAGADAGRLRVLDAGDRVTLRGRLAPTPDDLSGERARWRHAVALIDDAELVAFTPPRDLLASIANRFRGTVLRGGRALPPVPRALLSGFLLGDTRGIPDDVADEYRDSGLSHLLAVSGANVAFMLVLVAPLLQRLPLAGRTAAAVATVTCFAAATRFEPSVLRASVLTAVTVFATFVGRPTSRLRALLLAVAVLLLIDPFLIHSVGFQLSVGASVGIALFAGPLAVRVPGPRFVREPFAVSLAAQLGVTPVLLVVFGDVPAVTPIANLLAAPAADALGVYGMLASVAGGIVPPLAPVLQPVTRVLIAWVTGVAHAGAAIGGEMDARAVLLAGAATVIATLARRALRRPVPDAPAG
jgi:competence protein ComEC